MSSLLLNEFAEPEILEQGTVKYPVFSVIFPSMLNKAKSLESSLFDILKKPLIDDDESSMVLRYD